ncbi:MAG: SLBB domain-containing protein [Cyanobacteria bacterium J06634_6]
MRIHPLLTLGLTNVGIISWVGYGVSALNAIAAIEMPSSAETAVNQPEERPEVANTEKASQNLNLSKIAEVSGIPPLSQQSSGARPLNIQSFDIPSPEFTPHEADNAQLLITGATGEWANELPPLSSAELNSSQLKRVIARSLESRPDAEDVNAIAQSLGKNNGSHNAFIASQPSWVMPPRLKQASSRNVPIQVEPTVQPVAQRFPRFTAGPQFTTGPQFTIGQPAIGQLTPEQLTPEPFTSESLNAQGSDRIPVSMPGQDMPASQPSSFPAPGSIPTVSTPTVTPVPGISAGVDENYILGAGDIISVSFFNVPEYNGQHRISINGSINLPLIGRIVVSGMTLNQASDMLAERYFYQLQDPIVSINVLQQRPLQIAITGEITQPGLYTLSAEGTNYPRIFEALQQAGGLTQAANLKQVEVRRQEVNGTQSTLTINLLALLQNGDISQNIYLQDGDAISIPSASEIDQVALNELSLSNLRANLSRPVDVAIVGAVTQPGPYQLGGEGAQVTAVQALQAAGGIVPSADLRDIQLRRRTRQGDQQVFNINLWEALQTGDLSQDIALQQGDTLIVPTATEQSIEEITILASSTLSTGTIPINIIGEVETPGNLDVRANTSFNQALLAAGGLNRRSRQEATLIRFNDNGTVDRRTIDVDLDREIDSETNPILRPNDVIVVGRSARAAFDDNISGFSRTFNLVWPFLFLF